MIIPTMMMRNEVPTARAHDGEDLAAVDLPREVIEDDLPPSSDAVRELGPRQDQFPL